MPEGRGACRMRIRRDAVLCVSQPSVTTSLDRPSFAMAKKKSAAAPAPKKKKAAAKK